MTAPLACTTSLGPRNILNTRRMTAPLNSPFLMRCHLHETRCHLHKTKKHTVLLPHSHLTLTRQHIDIAPHKRPFLTQNRGERVFFVEKSELAAISR